jgi:hypothetical protein
MSSYPLLNFNWVDPSGSTVPIANSTFAYGTLGPYYTTTPTPNNEGYWGSLPVTSLTSNNGNFISKSSNYLTFNVSGIYELTTNLQFTGSGFSSSGTVYTFAFSYSTALNSFTSPHELYNGTAYTPDAFNTINGGIYFLDGSYNTDLSMNPLFINGSSCGGRGNYGNGFDSTNYGGNIVAIQNVSSGTLPTGGSACPPCFLLPNYSSGSNITGGNYTNYPINTVNAIYYIPSGTNIYFNITNAQTGAPGNDNSLDATGNFNVRMLNYFPTPTPTPIPNPSYPLLNFNWIDPNGASNVPIANSIFAYGTLGPYVYTTNTSPPPPLLPVISNYYWGSLPINSLTSSNSSFLSQSSNYLTFNVSGIYKLTTNLQFTGTDFSTQDYTFAFSYSTQNNDFGAIGTNTLLYWTSAASPNAYNSINGGINFLDGTNPVLSTTPLFINGSSCGGRGNYANGFDSTNYGGNIVAIQNTNNNSPNGCPPCFLLPNYSTGSTITGGNYTNYPINTVNAIYYIPAGTPIYFNIVNASGGTGPEKLNATGNFTVELLNYFPTPTPTPNPSYPLLNFNWIDPNGSSKVPIANSTFAYGTLSNYTSTPNNFYWGSLPVNSLTTSNSTFISQNSNYLTFNVSGIYELTTNLQFTGSGFSGSGTAYTFAFSYSTENNNNTSTYQLYYQTSSFGVIPAPYAYNSINGPIYSLDGIYNTILSTSPLFINGSSSGGRGNYGNGFDSSSYGGNIVAIQNLVPYTAPEPPGASVCPPCFLLPNWSSGSTITNVANYINYPINTVNAIYYIPAGTNIYFNIVNASGAPGGTERLNATGNFTVQLLNYMP